jgi:uncharacterized protein (DUF1697 family)
MSETYVALLRGVNVGGRRKVVMSDLRDLCTALGFEDPRTLLQSGNLVFGADRMATAKLESRLEAEAGRQMNVHCDFMVRTSNEWNKIVADNPFPEEAKTDPGHLAVHVLKKAPPRAAINALLEAVRGRETVEVRGAEAYIVYPDGMGRTKLTTALIEGKLDTRGTARNWNTVLKLAEMLSELS